MTHNGPILRPVGDSGVLVDFGGAGDAETRDKVRRLDAAISDVQPIGVLEQTPAMTSLLVAYDPLATDYRNCCSAIQNVLDAPISANGPGKTWRIGVSYRDAPDLADVAAATGLSETAVCEAHAAALYDVMMYGFAPGYAYLTGLPDILKLPRKPAPVQNVPAGSILIAGGQCLISTLTLPTGWWVIGRASTTPLQPKDPARPFLFDVGDQVRFAPKTS